MEREKSMANQGGTNRWSRFTRVSTLGLMAALTTIYACTDEVPTTTATPPDASNDIVVPGDYDLDSQTSGSANVNGAVWNWPADAKVGTGVINPFLKFQAAPFEEAFNQDLANNPPFDETLSNTSSLPLNHVPTISEGNPPVLYREFIFDAHEAQSTSETQQLAIRLFDMFICDDVTAPTPPNYDSVDDFDPNADCDPVYDLDHIVRATGEYSAGSGNGLDYQILIPESFFQAALIGNPKAAQCVYTGITTPPCGLYIVLHVQMGATDDQVAATPGEANYTTSATPEEISTVVRPVQLLTIVKQIVNDNGGAATVAAFNLNTDADGASSLIFGAGVPNGSTTTYTSNQLSVPVGTYSLTEGTVSGYTNGTWSCTGAAGAVVGTFNAGSVAIASGETVVCTIVNNDISPSLRLIKVVTNNNGGTATANAFTLTANGPSTLTGVSGVNGNVNAGTYNLSESTLTGYAQVGNWSCSGGTPGTNTVTLAVAQSATCTVFNDDISPTLRLIKIVTNNHGGTATAGNFTLTASGPSTLTGAGGANGNVNAGTYNLSESTRAGYSQVGNWSCQGGTPGTNTIALALAQNATCTVFNDDQPGRIIIIKNVSGGGNGTFQFATTGAGLPNPITIVTANSTGSSNNFPLSAGSYTVNENDTPGFALMDFACVESGGASQANTTDTDAPDGQANIGLEIGETVTCTYTNSGALTTRTQGFWQTHTGLAQTVWFGGTWNGINYPGVDPEDNYELCPGVEITTIQILMAGFWSGISQTSTKDKRSDLDQARMRLLQQLLAAILNNAAFGSSPTTVTIAQAKAAYCGTDIAAINLAHSAMANFNESGDSGLFTPGGSATAKESRELASQALVFWDILP
jgi:hypothetical protein